ncbi:DUF3078 domain-containing protein [Pedobacter antarcticus]|uniref:DUF3078 domain-containing protein n=1 Tax=Pedobacter antarcticus TaxID=34086 RepID=UPI00088E882D|nr:DUF3078 domain-containing protein [Pedobacter antarcticus]SDM75732.1 Protein of unknown function [Pedobacter antarcticus]
MRTIFGCLFILFAVSAQVQAQDVDSVPVNIKNYDLKLKRSPLPVLNGIIDFRPVDISPVVISSKVNYWKTTTAIGINVNQSSFSNNWTGGGVNSLAVGGLVNYKAEYVKENYSYVTELNLQYGKIKNRDQLQKKTNDRIFWDNKAAFQLSKNWYFFGSLTFESQFDNGFSYSTINNVETPTLISKFMSPGYLTQSIGFEYKPSKFFSTRIGTGTARQTFVLDNETLNAAKRERAFAANPNETPENIENAGKTDNYGIAYNKSFKNDLAFQVVTAFDKDIFHNVNLKTRYALFIPYDDLGQIDHRLDVAITAKINRFMNVSLTGVGLYDKDTDPKIQGSQTLAMGLMFVFPR